MLSTGAVTDAVVATLRDAVPGLRVWDATIDQTPLDPDGRVHPYAVVWAGAGRADQDRLTAGVVGLLWQAQITCAGGDRSRASWAVDRVRDTLTGALVPVPGHHPGRVREIGGSGPVVEDRAVRPTRWYTSLIMTLHLTRS